MGERHKTARARSRAMTHPLDAVLDDCRDIMTVIEALAGRDLGPDDGDVVEAAETAAGEALAQACAASTIVVAELAAREQLPDDIRDAVRAAALSPPDPDHECTACLSCCAAVDALPEDDQLRVDGYYAALHDAGTDAHSVVSQTSDWHQQLAPLVAGRGEIEAHLEAVLRISERFNTPRRSIPA